MAPRPQHIELQIIDKRFEALEERIPSSSEKKSAAKPQKVEALKKEEKKNISKSENAGKSCVKGHGAGPALLLQVSAATVRKVAIGMRNLNELKRLSQKLEFLIEFRTMNST